MHQTILSSNQIHRLHHTFFIPKGDIKASLLIVHGMSEHSGRYTDFANFLADNGILVLTFDLLGHGKTVKDRYELGFFDEKYPVQTLSKDVMIMVDTLKSQSKQLSNRIVPCFIMGHSMGSFLVRTVLTHHATSFDGVMLMGTANRYNAINQAGLLCLTALNRLRPKKSNHRLASLVNDYLLSQIRSPISPSPFAWLSENTKAIKAFEEDELTGFSFSNNGFFTLQSLLKIACSTHWYQHLPNNTPILLISGKDDPVGNMSQDILALQDTLIQAQKSVSSILYPNMRHEPLHETDFIQVYHDILHWLNQSLAQISSNLNQSQFQ